MISQLASENLNLRESLKKATEIIAKMKADSEQPKKEEAIVANEIRKATLSPLVEVHSPS